MHDDATDEIRLTFDRGTIVVEGASRALADRLPGVLWDGRVRHYRAPAHRCADLRRALRHASVAVDDRVLAPADARPTVVADVELRPYQQAALAAWQLGGHRGMVVLPTGSGKTRVAVAAIGAMRGRALCLVPTRVLLHQWIAELSRFFARPIGCWGDGARETAALTVATYESGVRHAAELGRRFELLV